MNLITYNLDTIWELGSIRLLPIVLISFKSLPAPVHDDVIVAQLFETSVHQGICCVSNELFADVVFEAVPGVPA